ncbi:hypothetical protein T492DRAFT_1106932 [Pavlovales sp. CCMP2436]|nr:hypothetical protein T492DRAFT_1106932 [Pavlovales sp. CCMP2436]
MSMCTVCLYLHLHLDLNVYKFLSIYIYLQLDATPCLASPAPPSRQPLCAYIIYIYIYI